MAFFRDPLRQRHSPGRDIGAAGAVQFSDPVDLTVPERRRDSSSSSRRWRRYWAFCIDVSKLILKNTQEAKVIGPSKIRNIFCRGLQYAW
jgi:hypothetical protein